MVNMCDSSDDDAFLSSSLAASYTGLWDMRRAVRPGM